VVLPIAAVLATPIGQDAKQWDALALLERQHPIIDHIGGGDGVLSVVELTIATLQCVSINVCW
jgi:hypothetical protein